MGKKKISVLGVMILAGSAIAAGICKMVRKRKSKTAKSVFSPAGSEEIFGYEV